VIEARVVADSTFYGRRLITLSCDYPRFIHPQVMTYGMIRKSTSSSRAIPVKRQLELSAEHAYIPDAFSKNKSGMAATEELSDTDYAHARALVESHLNFTRNIVEKLADLGVHKQHANRYLEPYLMTRCMMTGAYEAFEHLIQQRKHANLHGEVQPEMYELACKMDEAIKGSNSQIRNWHIPYYEGEQPTLQDALYGIARAARDSYMREDVSPEFLSRLEALWHEGHLGPFEHVAFFDFAPSISPYVLPFAARKTAETGYAPDMVSLTDLFGWRTARHIGIDKLRERFAK
jgi:hypothetical protein